MAMAVLLGIVLVILMCLSVESAQSSAMTRPSEGNQNSEVTESHLLHFACTSL